MKTILRLVPRSESKGVLQLYKPPLLAGDDSDLTVDLLSPPELHIMERTVNHLYKDIERQDGAEEAGRVVTDMLKISKCVQNNAFNGNACRKIINNWHLFYEVLPVNLKPLAEGLRLLNIVVLSCFGQKLEENARQSIQNLEDHYKLLISDYGLSVTVKFHKLFTHVLPFCDERQKGLGLFSEQPVESVHYEFLAAWNRFKVGPNHSEFGVCLNKAVTSYNSKVLVNVAKSVAEVLNLSK